MLFICLFVFFFFATSTLSWESLAGRKQGCCNRGFASGVGSPRSSVYHFQPGASLSLQDPA